MFKADNLFCKKTLIAAGVALASLSATAANYYLVVPVQKSAAAPPVITVSLNSYALPEGTVGLPYAGFNLNSLLTVTGDSAYAGSGATWQVVNGAIPTGLSLSSSGQLTGTPTAAGTGSFELKATYKTASGQQSYQVVVAELQVALASATMPAGMVGAAYNYDFKGLLSVTGDSAYTVDQASFSVASGSLPPGLSLSAGGVVSGTPTTKNTSGNNFQVLASYKTKSGQQAYTIVVNGVVLQVTSLAAGAHHTCAVTLAGGLKCWGLNNHGQLGNNNTQTSLNPVDVTGLTAGVLQVSANTFNTCAVTTAGAAKCWGYNANGQLGNNSTTESLVPAQVSGLTTGVTMVSSGGPSTCAVVSGAAKCWGSNSAGNLGDGTTTQRLIPVAVSGLTSGIAAVASGQHSCALTSAGAMKCWGWNTSGEVGDNSTFQRNTPVAVSGLSSGVTQIATGNTHTCAVVNGGAKCWGSNADGRLGDGTTANRMAPVSVSGLTSGITSVSAGGNHTCATTSSGQAVCWGQNTNGQLGDGSLTSSSVPVVVSGAGSVSGISAGGLHTCALTAGGAKCWGYNAYGQFGDGTTTSSSTPHDVLP